jgi:hypothetical protein
LEGLLPAKADGKQGGDLDKMETVAGIFTNVGMQKTSVLGQADS